MSLALKLVSRPFHFPEPHTLFRNVYATPLVFVAFWLLKLISISISFWLIAFFLHFIDFLFFPLITKTGEKNNRCSFSYRDGGLESDRKKIIASLWP